MSLEESSYRPNLETTDPPSLPSGFRPSGWDSVLLALAAAVAGAALAHCVQ